MKRLVFMLLILMIGTLFSFAGDDEVISGTLEIEGGNFLVVNQNGSFDIIPMAGPEMYEELEELEGYFIEFYGWYEGDTFYAESYVVLEEEIVDAVVDTVIDVIDIIVDDEDDEYD